MHMWYWTKADFIGDYGRFMEYYDIYSNEKEKGTCVRITR